MSPPGYEVVLVRKGATVHVCERCGAVVAWPVVHDAYHALQDAADALARE